METEPEKTIQEAIHVMVDIATRPTITEEPLLMYHWGCPYVHRVTLALGLKKASIPQVFIDLYDKPSWLTEYSPLGKVPAITYLEGGKQQVLYESLALVFWVDEYFKQGPSLMPQSAAQRAKARIIIARFDSAALPPWYRACKAQTLEEFTGALGLLRAELTWLEENSALADGSPYLMGSEPGLVDAVVGPWILRDFLIQHAKNVNMFARHPKLGAYAERFRQLPEVQATFQAPGGGGWEGYVKAMNEGFTVYTKQQLDFSSVDALV